MDVPVGHKHRNMMKAIAQSVAFNRYLLENCNFDYACGKIKEGALSEYMLNVNLFNIKNADYEEIIFRPELKLNTELTIGGKDITDFIKRKSKEIPMNYRRDNIYLAAISTDLSGIVFSKNSRILLNASNLEGKVGGSRIRLCVHDLDGDTFYFLQGLTYKSVPGGIPSFMAIDFRDEEDPRGWRDFGQYFINWSEETSLSYMISNHYEQKSYYDLKPRAILLSEIVPGERGHVRLKDHDYGVVIPKQEYKHVVLVSDKNGGFNARLLQKSKLGDRFAISGATEIQFSLPSG